jgi:uncharacterized protein (TIGR00297 family)
MYLTPLDFGLSLGLSLLVAAAAWKKGSLSLSGFFAATILGTLVWLLGQWLFWSILIAFFIPSSLLSRFQRENKTNVEKEYAKSGRRDWVQVAANGLVGLSFAAGWAFSQQNPLWAAGYYATFAAVNADTWATEIGVLSQRPPVSILTLKPVSPGMSGAVSRLGTTAALGGALFIATASAIGLGFSTQGNINLARLALVTTIGGFTGALIDSLLGATLQAMYSCPRCGKLTERREHCGQPTSLARGLARLNNDLVNAVSSLAGALLAIALWLLLS